MPRPVHTLDTYHTATNSCPSYYQMLHCLQIVKRATTIILDTTQNQAQVQVPNQVQWFATIGIISKS